MQRGNLQEDLKLEEFEQRIYEAVTAGEGIDKLNSGDAIPAEIRNEFNLPVDMKGFEIDFTEVRLKDAGVNKNNFVWSG